VTPLEIGAIVAVVTLLVLAISSSSTSGMKVVQFPANRAATAQSSSPSCGFAMLRPSAMPPTS
jgi:hypothetical protein